METKRHFAIYIRVSTQKQGMSGLGLDAQEKICEDYIRSKSGECVALFKDVESGTHRDRSGLNSAIDFCKQTGSELVIAKLDRLARDVEFVFKVVNTGIEIHFCDMPVVNTMILGVFASVAQYERELNSARTKQSSFSPLRARFGIQCHLEYYDAPVLARIVKRSARILDISIDDEAAMEVALRSRGTPRIANALLRRVRDFAMVKGEGHIDLGITRVALTALNIDSRGLDRMDNRILSTIIEKFKGGPVGLNTIATAVGEEAGTIEDVYEPFLIKEGFIKRTPRGREATELAYRHMGLTPDRGDSTLF